MDAIVCYFKIGWKVVDDGKLLVHFSILPFCPHIKKIFKPTSNNLETITDNESNFNNENNLLLIDVEPALAKGTQIKGKVYFNRGLTSFKNFFQEMLTLYLTIKTLKMMVLIMMRVVQLILPWIVEHSVVSQVVSWILISF